jgi:hypothetical protein
VPMRLAHRHVLDDLPHFSSGGSCGHLHQNFGN